MPTAGGRERGGIGTSESERFKSFEPTLNKSHDMFIFNSSQLSLSFVTPISSLPPNHKWATTVLQSGQRVQTTIYHRLGPSIGICSLFLVGFKKNYLQTTQVKQQFDDSQQHINDHVT